MDPGDFGIKANWRQENKECLEVKDPIGKCLFLPAEISLS